VLAGILTRDGGQLTATDTLERELSRADHLGVLGGIWDDLTRRAQHARFEQALRDALPATEARQALADQACTWLWRTLREAEAAGLDGIYPQLHDASSSRVPDTVSTELNRYLRELAAAMDDRARRLGEHAAESGAEWAVGALGPVPCDPAARADWERRGSLIAAYRERYGHDHPADPIGPAPGKTSPEARAAWHTALAALGHIDGIDLRACTDGDLWLRRGTYERETAWAPPHVAEELRLMRVAQRDAHVAAVRADHEARAAQDENRRDENRAARHRQLAGIWQALEAKAASEAEMFAAVQGTRRGWEALTETDSSTRFLGSKSPGSSSPSTAPYAQLVGSAAL